MTSQISIDPAIANANPSNTLTINTSRTGWAGNTASTTVYKGAQAVPGSSTANAEIAAATKSPLGIESLLF